MMERVSLRRENSPIFLVSPHSAPGDDINTHIIVEHLSNYLKCNAIINRGWKRGDTYDYGLEQADCNNVSHMVDVVADEFLIPVISLKNEILRRFQHCHIFFIHGMAAKEGVDIVIGYGAGHPNSFSCELWRKNLMYKLLDNALSVWVGKQGGKYSGWARNNMNQYFRKHYRDDRVESMQLEISRELRTDRGVCELTAEYIGDAMRDYLNYGAFNENVTTKEL